MKKIITVGGQELIVLSPFLDSLGNFAFKNIDLAPGIPNTCFQHPQDIVICLVNMGDGYRLLFLALDKSYLKLN